MRAFMGAVIPASIGFAPRLERRNRDGIGSNPVGVPGNDETPIAL